MMATASKPNFQHSPGSSNKPITTAMKTTTSSPTTTTTTSRSNHHDVINTDSNVDESKPAETVADLFAKRLRTLRKRLLKIERNEEVLALKVAEEQQAHRRSKKQPSSSSSPFSGEFHQTSSPSSVGALVPLNVDQLKAIEKKEAVLELINELENLQGQILELQGLNANNNSKKNKKKSNVTTAATGSLNAGGNRKLASSMCTSSGASSSNSTIGTPGSGTATSTISPVTFGKQVFQLWFALSRLSAIPTTLLTEEQTLGMCTLSSILHSLIIAPSGYETSGLDDLLSWMEGTTSTSTMATSSELLPYSMIKYCVEKVLKSPLEDDSKLPNTISVVHHIQRVPMAAAAESTVILSIGDKKERETISNNVNLGSTGTSSATTASTTSTNYPVKKAAIVTTTAELLKNKLTSSTTTLTISSNKTDNNDSRVIETAHSDPFTAIPIGKPLVTSRLTPILNTNSIPANLSTNTGSNPLITNVTSSNMNANTNTTKSPFLAQASTFMMPPSVSTPTSFSIPNTTTSGHPPPPLTPSHHHHHPTSVFYEGFRAQQLAMASSSSNSIGNVSLLSSSSTTMLSTHPTTASLFGSLSLTTPTSITMTASTGANTSASASNWTFPSDSAILKAVPFPSNHGNAINPNPITVNPNGNPIDLLNNRSSASPSKVESPSFESSGKMTSKIPAATASLGTISSTVSTTTSASASVTSTSTTPSALNSNTANSGAFHRRPPTTSHQNNNSNVISSGVNTTSATHSVPSTTGYYRGGRRDYPSGRRPYYSNQYQKEMGTSMTLHPNPNSYQENSSTSNSNGWHISESSHSHRSTSTSSSATATPTHHNISSDIKRPAPATNPHRYNNNINNNGSHNGGGKPAYTSTMMSSPSFPNRNGYHHERSSASGNSAHPSSGYPGYPHALSNTPSYSSHSSSSAGHYYNEDEDPIESAYE